MSTAKSYFDKHAEHPSYNSSPDFYIPIIEYLKEFKSDGKFTILDFGCGSGTFIKGMMESGIDADFYGSDVSLTMISLAKNNLKDQKIGLFVADGFMLPINNETRFDLIHVDCVLHHIIGKTRRRSFNLASKMISTLINLLSKNGILVVREITYESYLFKNLTSWLVFYGLKFLNFSKLNLNWLNKEIVTGLEVNFFYEKQLEQMLNHYGNLHTIKNRSWKASGLRRLFLLKKEGRVSYVVKPVPMNTRSK